MLCFAAFIVIQRCFLVQSAVIGEFGVEAVTQTWKYVSFSQPFTNPVVVAGDPTLNEGEVATTNIKQVDTNGFWVRLAKSPSHDGIHISENIYYIVVESGTNYVSDGTMIQAGTFTTNNTYPENFPPFQPFPIAFTATNPTVLTQRTTAELDDWMVTRLVTEGKLGFRAGLQHHESTNSGPKPTETISWVAVDTKAEFGNGMFGSGSKCCPASPCNGNTASYGTLAFGATFNSSVPIVKLGGVASAIPVNARFHKSDTGLTHICGMEDVSVNSVQNHPNEGVAWIVRAGIGTIEGHSITTSPTSSPTEEPMPACPYSTLFISQIQESATNHRYIQVYNPTYRAVDVSRFSFAVCNNGCSDPHAYDYTIHFQSSFPKSILLPRRVYTICDTGFAPTTHGCSEFQSMSFDGMDYIALMNISHWQNGSAANVIDSIGILAESDPGSAFTVCGVHEEEGAGMDLTTGLLQRSSIVCCGATSDNAEFNSTWDKSYCSWNQKYDESNLAIKAYTGPTSCPLDLATIMHFSSEKEELAEQVFSDSDGFWNENVYRLVLGSIVLALLLTFIISVVYYILMNSKNYNRHGGSAITIL